MAEIGRRAAYLRWIAVLAAAGLAGCAPDTAYVGPKFPFAASYRAAKSGAPVLLANAEWWRRFEDPVLDKLVVLALKDSLTIAVARERVIQAQAELRRVPAATNLTSSIGVQATGTEKIPFDGLGEGELGFDWMLDPSGARRNEIRAAGARVEAADAEADAAQLLLLYNLANAYVDLRFRQQVLQLRRQELQMRQQTLAMTRQMLVANSVTRLDITRAEARVAEVQAQLPGLEAAVTVTQNEIAVLAGMAPGTLPVNLRATGGQPRPRMAPDVGIPADLLRNRPDIRIAERRYYAAVADIGVARAELYPRLSLTGAISLNALEGGSRGAEYYFGPLVQFPALPAGSARASVELRDSLARQALVGWKSTVLTAILEVENALLDYQAVTASMNAAVRASRLYAEALDLTQEVFLRQEATFTDLIDAQQALAISDNALAEARHRQGLSFIALNVRLGSGNKAAQAATAAPGG